MNDAQTDTLHAHPHRHALAAEEVVFGDGGGRSPAFFGGGVVYVVGGGDTEGVGVVHLAVIDVRAARAGVGDEILARLAVYTNLDSVGGEAKSGLKKYTLKSQGIFEQN